MRIILVNNNQLSGTTWGFTMNIGHILTMAARHRNECRKIVKRNAPVDCGAMKILIDS